MTQSDEKPRRARRPIYSYVGQTEDTDVNELTAAQVISGFSEGSGIHGIPNVYGSYGYIKKIFWIAMTLAMTGLCINNVYWNIHELLSYDVNVNVDVTTVRELPFPAVTACNLNAFKLSALPSDLLNYLQNSSATQGIHDNGPSFGENTGLGTSKSSQLSTQEVLSEALAGKTLSERLSYGYQFKDFMLSCNFGGYDCLNENQWQVIWNWKYGNCFVFNTNQSMRRLESHTAGPDYGLVLVLNTDQAEYVPVVSDMVGSHILVHEPTEMPFPEDVGVYVAPGTNTGIGVRKMDLSRLGGRYGACHDTTVHDYSLNAYEEVYNWTNYTLSACQKTCWQQMVISQCSCFDSNYPPLGQAFGNVNVEPCSLFNSTQVTCKEARQQEYIQDTSCPQCIRACNQTAYDVTVSSAMWPANTYTQSLLSTFDQSLVSVQNLVNGNTSVTENLMQVEIYYEELNYETISESAAYTESNFMSDLGGAVGLWVGASVMSAGELVELLVDLIVLVVSKHCCSGQKRKSAVDISGLEKNNTELNIYHS